MGKGTVVSTSKKALRLLAEELGTEDLKVVADARERLPDGRTLHRVAAVSPDAPNSGATVVVDAGGERVAVAVGDVVHVRPSRGGSRTRW